MKDTSQWHKLISVTLKPLSQIAWFYSEISEYSFLFVKILVHRNSYKHKNTLLPQYNVHHGTTCRNSLLTTNIFKQLGCNFFINLLAFFPYKNVHKTTPSDLKPTEGNGAN